MNQIRRSTCFLAVSCLSLLAFHGVASAAPTVTFTAAALPIPGFADTGNLFDAGAALQTKFTIKGTEYVGYQPPLIAVHLNLPAGVTLNPAAFPVCANQAIREEREPAKCPAGAVAGHGSIDGFVVFGTERVPEKVSTESFFAPSEQLNTFLSGHTPASIEVVAPAAYSQSTAGAEYGPELTAAVPLIATVPGAPYASIETIDETLGAAIEKNGVTNYYMTMPAACPHRDLPVRAELVFAENGLGGSPQTVSAVHDMPCPGGEARAPETPIQGTGGAITAPAGNVCVSRRHFTIHVIQIKHLVYRQVSVYVNGHRVNVVRGRRISAPVDLRGLPKGRYTVRITVTTSSGQQITGTRSYHTCAPKPLKGGRSRL